MITVSYSRTLFPTGDDYIYLDLAMYADSLKSYSRAQVVHHLIPALRWFITWWVAIACSCSIPKTGPKNGTQGTVPTVAMG